MKKLWFIVLFLLGGTSSFSMMKNSTSDQLNSSLKKVIDRLPFQMDDPIKEIGDTEEEEAFEILIKSELTDEQQSALLQAIGVYSQIIYDFPFAYPNYDEVKDREILQKVTQKYNNRIEKLNEIICKNIELI